MPRARHCHWVSLGVWLFLLFRYLRFYSSVIFVYSLPLSSFLHFRYLRFFSSVNLVSSLPLSSFLFFRYLRFFLFRYFRFFSSVMFISSLPLSSFLLFRYLRFISSVFFVYSLPLSPFLLFRYLRFFSFVIFVYSVPSVANGVQFYRRNNAAQRLSCIITSLPNTWGEYKGRGGKLRPQVEPLGYSYKSVAIGSSVRYHGSHWAFL